VPSFNTALSLWRSGRRREALAEAMAAHAHAPDSVDLLNLLAMIHASLQEPAAVAKYLRRVTHLTPRDPAAHLRLADAERSAGNTTASISSYRRVIELEPRNAVAQTNLGVLLEQVGDSNGAAACYRKVLALDDTNVVAHYNLGNLLLQSGRPGDALACYQRAVALRPDFAAAWCNCAGTLLRMKHTTDALACADKALAWNASFPEAWHMRAAALKELQRTEEALSCCERAIALRKDYAEAIYVRANVLRNMGDRAGAIASFREVLRLSPGIEEARMAAVVAEVPVMQSSAEDTSSSRQAFRAAVAALETDLERRPCVDATAMIGTVQPFHLAYQEEDNRELLGVYGRLCSSLMGGWQNEARLAPAPTIRAPRSRVRVGFVSAHIATHPVYTAITRGWLRRLDPERFELEVFHLGTKEDPETTAARAMVASYSSGYHTLEVWVRTILDRRPDVLIYPEVGMDQQTLQLASMRLAPIQAAAWGHPITTGLPTIDYYISAEAFEPADGSSHYTEQLIKLPGLGTYYEPPEYSPETARIDLSRDQGGPVFVCAGTPFKYSPAHDRVFVEIARRLRRCRFYFFSYQDGVLTRRLLSRLHDAFAAEGLDAACHLVLRPWAPPGEFHAFLKSADLLLDTIGFSGFNTVVQALACDLPVVTFRGRFMRGRLGSGILEKLSLGELVADSPQHYADIVVSLAQSPAALEQARDRLRRNLPALYRDQAAIDALEKFLAI
jgi:protein O-GlcNAc transferase